MMLWTRARITPIFPDTGFNQKNFWVSIGVYFRAVFAEARGERVDRAGPHTTFRIALGQLAFRL